MKTSNDETEKMVGADARIEPVRDRRNDYDLTDREREILHLLADGLPKNEIAKTLSISVHTVSTHLRRVYRKFEVRTNTGAVAKAIRNGDI